MIKRIVVAGCRDYENYGEAKAFIDLCIKEVRENNTLIFLSAPGNERIKHYQHIRAALGHNTTVEIKCRI